MWVSGWVSLASRRKTSPYNKIITIVNIPLYPYLANSRPTLVYITVTVDPIFIQGYLLRIRTCLHPRPYSLYHICGAIMLTGLILRQRLSKRCALVYPTIISVNLMVALTQSCHDPLCGNIHVQRYVAVNTRKTAADIESFHRSSSIVRIHHPLRSSSMSIVKHYPLMTCIGALTLLT